MASKNLQRRHAKAVNRKKLLQERRRAETVEASGSLANSVRRAAAAPVHACFVQDSVFEAGMGMVILSRETGTGRFATGAFMVDAYCLGVKDVNFRELGEEELNGLLDGIGTTARLAPVELPHARKLLHDAAAYAQSLGLPPHPDYAVVEPLFGDTDADACDVPFVFGFKGRPLYVPGPKESATQIRRRLDRLRRKLGDDAFDFGMPADHAEALGLVDETDDDDEALYVEEVFAEDGYDPNIAPDPTDWLALDEGVRISQAEEYHRRAGISLPNEKVHGILHTMIENQIAIGDELPVRRALDRLVGQGLDRHEAVHALGSLVTAHIFDAVNDPEAHAFPVEAYNAAVEAITAESWRRQWEEDEE